MTDHEFGDTPQAPFDADYLKSLTLTELSEALLDEAHQAIVHLPDSERHNAETQVMETCRIPSEAGIANYEKVRELRHELVDEFRETWDAAAVEAEPFTLGSTGKALEAIDRLKESIDRGISGGPDSDWTAGSTKHALISICTERRRAGISYAEDYVRETATESLQPNYRSIVLLNNALADDYASYQLGVEALQEAVGDESLGLGEAREAAVLVMELMREKGPEERATLSDLAVDVLGRIRRWNGLFPNSTAAYAVIAARLAVACRNLED